MSLKPGTRLGRYEIVELCGRGGMGEVYRARDSRLRREVAVKTLTPELSDDPLFQRRLEREAQAISQLQHPNVCTLFDIGYEGGVHYLVMEFLEGETLEERVRGGALPFEDVLGIGKQVASAVGAAHDRGLVHRDLKPGNVMLTAGRAKVLDFGLAREVASSGGGVDTQAETIAAITARATIVGTMPYMAPELLEGKEADQRSDVWALGCLLYEMATGERAFRGRTQASLISAIMAASPELLSRRESLAPESFGAMVKRCLERDPAGRWPTAKHVADELGSGRTTRQGLATRLRSKEPGGRHDQAGDQSLRPAPSPPRAFESPPLIMVLPFDSLGPAGEAYFASGLTEEIRTGLGNIQGVAVIAGATADQVARSGMSIAEIGNQLDVNYVLTGKVRFAPGQDEVRITPELIRISDQTSLWREDFDRVVDEMFTVQEEISTRVAQQLDVSLLRADSGAESSVRWSAAAIRAYLRGRDLGRGAHHVPDAIGVFETAVDIEPEFALAWARLAESHFLMSLVLGDQSAARHEAARRAIEQALKWGPDLRETRVSLGLVHWLEGKLDAARRELEQAARAAPGDMRTVGWWGVFLFRNGDARGSIPPLTRTAKLDPLTSMSVTNVALAHMYLRDYEEAERWIDLAIPLRDSLNNALCIKAWNASLWKGWDAVEVDGWPDTSFQAANYIRFQTLLATGRYDEAMTTIRRFPDEGYVYQKAVQPRAFMGALVKEARGDDREAERGFEEARVDLEARQRKNPEDGRVLTTLGLACAKLGRSKEAARYGEQGEKLSGPGIDTFTGQFRLYDLAQIYALVGDSRSALDRLEELLKMPAPVSVPLIESELNLASLRELASYRRLLEHHR